MNDEERRIAMLRMRGELPEKQNEQNRSAAAAQKKTPAPSKNTNNKNQKNQVKNNKSKTQKKAVNSLAERRELVRKRKQRALYIRLGIYALAGIVLLFVLVSMIKGCISPEHDTNSKESLNQETIDSVTEAETEAEETEEIRTNDAEMTVDAQQNSTIEQPSVLDVPTTTTASAINVGAAGKMQPSIGGADWPVQVRHIPFPDWIQEALLTPNEYSRPIIPLTEVRYVAIHWVANPGSTAINNRNYFEQLGMPEDPAYASRKASAHFVVGLDGEVIQCMPLDEMAYAVRDKFNPYTISIEVCHPDSEGKFSWVTYQSVIKLTAWLLQQFGLGEDAILRHHDCDGKDCPKYYVEHPEAWEQLKKDVMDYSASNPNIR